MKYVEYNPVEEKGSCIIRTFTKLFDKNFFEIKSEVIELSKELGYSDYREIEVFEKYLYDNGYVSLDLKDMLVKDLKLDNGKYAVFCYRDDFYHMIPIVDNVVYDKNNDSLDLYVIKVYKLNE